MRSLTLLSAGVLALCGALLATNPPDPMIGGSYGRTIRIAITAGPNGCSAEVGFRNSLAQPPNPDTPLILGPGQTGLVDLSLNRLAPRLGQRVELRPFVHATSGQCQGSVEVFEVFTGRTTASLRLGLAQPPEPYTPSLAQPPEPNFPALGVVRGQTVRLGVARTANPPEPVTPSTVNPPDPVCQAVVGFTDASGNTVGQQKPIVQLGPGQLDFVDLDLLKVPSSIGGRVAVRPVLLPTAVGSLAGCQASVQVFEQLTGWTTVVMQGR